MAAIDPGTGLGPPPTTGAWELAAGEHASARACAPSCSLASEVAGAIFDRAGRDVESIGLAYVDADVSTAVLALSPRRWRREVLRSVIRILGTSRRYQGNERRTSRSRTPPRTVTAYLRPCRQVAATRRSLIDAVAEHGSQASSRRMDCCGSTASTRSSRLVELVRVRSAGSARRCARSHLHPSAGVCSATGCHRRATGRAAGRARTRHGDYYGWLAEQAPRRLRVRELTGQTKPLERAARPAAAVQGGVPARAAARTPGRRHRRPQRHHDDGGRRRHRLAALGDDGQHAAAALQLPAARRSCWSSGPAVLLRR